MTLRVANRKGVLQGAFMNVTPNAPRPQLVGSPTSVGNGASGRSSLDVIWDGATATGFVAIPSVLLVNFKTLGVNPTEMLVLLNLLSFWRPPEHSPYPKVSTIARRLNVDPRTVQRAIRNMEGLGLIRTTRVQVQGKLIKKNARPGDGVRRRVFDMSPLVARARTLASRAEEFRSHRNQPGDPPQIAV
jgi:hypothetical protein